MSYGFEWDVNKAKSNQIRYGISFDEAATVFDDPLARIFDDELHSSTEAREIIIGHSIRDRLLVTCFARTIERVDSHHQRSFTNKERTEGL